MELYLCKQDHRYFQDRVSYFLNSSTSSFISFSTLQIHAALNLRGKTQALIVVFSLVFFYFNLAFFEILSKSINSALILKINVCIYSSYFLTCSCEIPYFPFIVRDACEFYDLVKFSSLSHSFPTSAHSEWVIFHRSRMKRLSASATSAMVDCGDSSKTGGRSAISECQIIWRGRKNNRYFFKII